MNKTEEVLVNNKILRAAVLPLPEPFMSLLLVLSHMDFKLDMEVRATTVIFSNHFELRSNKNFLFLYTELQFSG